MHFHHEYKHVTLQFGGKENAAALQPWNLVFCKALNYPLGKKDKEILDLWT